MKKLVLLLFALVVATALSVAQTTPSTDKSGSATSDTSTTTTTSKTVHHAKHSSATSTEKLDINTATKEQLEALPGIGEKYSQKIIDGRPYRAKNDLVSKKIIPRAVYEKIKADIVAHRVASTAATTK